VHGTEGLLTSVPVVQTVQSQTGQGQTRQTAGHHPAGVCARSSSERREGTTIRPRERRNLASAAGNPEEQHVHSLLPLLVEESAGLQRPQVFRVADFRLRVVQTQGGHETIAPVQVEGFRHQTM